MTRVAIIGGGGLMGHGIALASLSRPGTEVILVSRRQESLDHGLHLVRHGPFGLQRAVERGKLTREQADQRLARLSGTLDFQTALADVDLVVETVPENTELKRDVLGRVEQHAPPTALLASGTSAIMIAELAGALTDPARLIGTHWFYPANVMPLVEVARGELTHPHTVETVVGFLRDLGKQPVVVADSPGFFMTRFINTFIAEAIRLVELGVANPTEIDQMVKTGLGWPMGIFELLDDTASFDSWYHAQHYLHTTCGDRYAIPPLARKVFHAGYRGNPTLKPGSRGGWHDYLNHTKPHPDQH